MTRSVLALAILIIIAVAPAASGHTAAPPRDHEVRLLHDCNDDYFGSDVLGEERGHELHALDLFEAWDQTLGDVVVFRLILAGTGAGEIQLTYSNDGNQEMRTWKTTGSKWTGTFDRVEGPFPALKADGAKDGDRFVLHGMLSAADLGGPGTKISGYRVQSSSGNEEADAMPGYDGAVTGSCTDDYKRPQYVLQGPVQYAELDVEKSSLALEVGQEVLVQVTASNLLRDQAQDATISLTGASGVDARMHDPASDRYTAQLEMALNKKGQAGHEKIAHVAITATTAEASGVLQVVLTTDAGGRTIQAIAYAVGQAPPPITSATATAGDDSPENESPGLSAILALGVLAAVAFVRRRE